jgi:steroid 5-alpha reductase family enzyme
MFDIGSYLFGLGILILFGICAWAVSVVKRDVSIVDSLWSVMFMMTVTTYYLILPSTGPRTVLVLLLVFLWALRLSLYITWRNWGEAEDRRYQAIRANNEPNFAIKSIYIVFLLQCFIAWIISLPLLAAIHSPAPINVFDYLGIGLWLVGMIFEAGGDYQLQRFKADSNNRGKVLNSGLWRYTRHPNYFGNACIWFGFGVIACAAGGWWALISPIIMTLLLVKVSGVNLLEQDIEQRRPGYTDYIERTNAFIPWIPKDATLSSRKTSDHD